MCGITGIYSFNLVGKFNKVNITAATQSLKSRGPDFQDIYIDEHAGLGHRRLCIIDTSSAGHQPMWDERKRYGIVFNGEIFNYRELRDALEASGERFISHSDTEVLLKLFIRDGVKSLQRLNGFFSFCIYDKQEQSFFLARDRFGVKPLLYCHDEDKFIFASEMKAMLRYGIERTLDYTSLYAYLQLNYIPAPDTIYNEVKKLLPGHYMMVKNRSVTTERYYDIPFHRETAEKNTLTYEAAKNTFADLLEKAVQRRLVADVPLGAFLSGGIDSSVIAGLAKKHKEDLHTFSIGFRDHRFFDETSYARLVAKHFRTEHTVFSLTNQDLLDHVYDVLDYTDEPFADSSALNVYILSRETRKHATVALSGDGADELLGGYNKHAAFLRMRFPGVRENVVNSFYPLLRHLPQSRSGKLSNIFRQMARFGEGSRLDARARYWRWAGYASESAAFRLLNNTSRDRVLLAGYHARKDSLLRAIPDDYVLNDILYTDTRFVLPNDMLTKVDMMSMAQGLEVRTPFLDVDFVNFVYTLPSHYKIDRRLRKKILQDTYRDFLPRALYNRPKKGFEVPLLPWFRKELRSLITDELLSREFIEKQHIFDYTEIEKLKKQLFSAAPGDVHARIWALIVFQWWWRKYN